MAPPAAFKASLDRTGQRRTLLGKQTGLKGRHAAQHFAGIVQGSALVGDVVVIVPQIPESEVGQQHPVNRFLALSQ